MEKKPCVECVWCNGSIGNFFRNGSFYGCTNPETADPVTGKATRSCEQMRNWDHYCGSHGRLFKRKPLTTDPKSV